MVPHGTLTRMARTRDAIKTSGPGVARRLSKDPVLQKKAAALYRSGLSCKAVGEKIGLDAQVVRTMLRRQGVKTRTGPKDPARDKRIAMLYEKYRNCATVAKEIGTTRTIVRAILLRMGIKVESRRSPKERDDLIVKLYESGMSAVSIAPLVGMKGTSAFEVLYKRGIKRRGVGRYKGYHTPEWYAEHEQVKKVAHLYETKKYPSAEALAALIGIQGQAMRRHLRILGIYKEGTKWTTRLDAKTVKKIKAELVAEKFTLAKIAERYRVSPGHIAAIAHEREWVEVPWPKGKKYRRRGHGFWAGRLGYTGEEPKKPRKVGGHL
jgi:transposase